MPLIIVTVILGMIALSTGYISIDLTGSNKQQETLSEERVIVPTPLPIPNPSSQNENEILRLVANLQEVKEFKKRVDDIGRTKPVVAIDGYPNSESPYYIVHVFEEVSDSADTFHTATFNWYRVDPKTWTVIRMDLSKYDKWDVIDTKEGNIITIPTPTPTEPLPKIAQQPATHDGTRTGPIVDYFEFCAGKTISVYENERLPYEVDGETLFITQGDINCYENLLKVASGNTGVVKQAEDAIVNQRGLPTLEIAKSIRSEPPKEVLNPMIIGKGTSYTDSLGFTHFSGENGVTGTAYTDSLGFTHYSDSTGKTATFHTDSLGFTTGDGITAHTDNLGFTHFGGGGLSGTAHTDSLGFTHYSDNLGRSTTCHTNTIGFTSCY